MDDAAIHERIEQLVAEEHELWQRESDGDMDDATRQRLHDLQVQLDQTWDLLRQRKALRGASMDPDVATERDPTRSSTIGSKNEARVGPRRETERAGFEPAKHLSALTRFPVALLRPLGHLSAAAQA